MNFLPWFRYSFVELVFHCRFHYLIMSGGLWKCDKGLQVLPFIWCSSHSARNWRRSICLFFVFFFNYVSQLACPNPETQRKHSAKCKILSFGSTHEGLQRLLSWNKQKSDLWVCPFRCNPRLFFNSFQLCVWLIITNINLHFSVCSWSQWCRRAREETCRVAAWMGGKLSRQPHSIQSNRRLRLSASLQESGWFFLILHFVL